MQHVFEFIAIKKENEEDALFNKDPGNIIKIIPQTINRYYNSESSRKAKVTKKIYEDLKKEPFNIQDAEKELDKFYIRQIR